MSFTSKRIVYIIFASVFIFAVIASVVYAVHKQNSSSTTERSVTKNVSYASLGDSVAAGYGLFTPGKNEPCQQKTEAYPNLVAASLSMELTQLACTGAQVNNGIVSSQTLSSGVVNPRQLDGLFGMPEQPKLITITAGANDLNWIPILQSCFTADCSAQANKDALESRYPAFIDTTKTMLNEIRDHYPNSKPDVVVTGYYQIFPASIVSGCQNMPNVTQTEVDWWRQVTDTFNQRLQQAVSGYDFVTFVTPDFAGHELCTDRSWIQGFQSSAPFHPNEEGQQGIADIVIKTYPVVAK